MQPSVLRRRRLVPTLAIAVGLVLLAGAGVFGAPAVSGPAYEKKGSLHCVEDGKYLYTFDAVWRVETLRRTDAATGIASVVVPPDAARLERMRSDLFRSLKVVGLDGIPVEGKAELAALRALGYL